MPQLLYESIYDFESPNELSNHMSASGSKEIKRQCSKSNCDDKISSSSSSSGSISSSSNIIGVNSVNETIQHPPPMPIPPPPPPPQFSKKLFQLATLKPEQSETVLIVPPPPPLPPSFRYRTATPLSASSKETVTSIPPPPLPQEPTQPPPPPTADSDTIPGTFCEETSPTNTLASIEIEIANESDVLLGSVEMFPQISQWVAVDAVPPIEVVMEVGMWERHTKGIGGRLLERMGYVRGLGLGKTAQGRLLPVEAVCCSGLGRGDGESDNYTVDGNAIAEADGTGKGPYEVKRSQSQSEFGDSLYSAVTTKPVGSGGFKKKKGGAQTNGTAKKKNETVFDFLNKIPNSNSSDIKQSDNNGKVLPKKEIKKVVAKSVF